MIFKYVQTKLKSKFLPVEMSSFDQNCGIALEQMIQWIVMVGPLPLSPGLPCFCFAALPLPCIILNAN